MSLDGLAPREWREDGKRRLAYVGVAAHASAGGIGSFIVIAEDIDALEAVWNCIFDGRNPLDASKVKEAGLCSINHINEMAANERAPHHLFRPDGPRDPRWAPSWVGGARAGGMTSAASFSQTRR